MRVLWIVNILLPSAAEYLGVPTGASGTWLIDRAKRLAGGNETELAVACVYGNEYKKFVCGGITYYLLPGNGKNMLFYTRSYERLWQKINEDFKPDLVNVHGTEYSHGLAFMRACPNVKSIVSIQGLLNRIKDEDLGGIPIREFVKNRTVGECLRFNGPLEKHWLYKRNCKYENEMIERATALNCITRWDESIVRSIKPQAAVFGTEYTLREEFYASRKWDIDRAIRHTIFTNPGGSPLKGVHQLLRAVTLLRDKYPDIRVVVPGMGVNGKLCVDGSYSKYIKKLIKSEKIERNVEFWGVQTAAEMCDKMLDANVVVVPSAIEGSSLFLREAMYLGCPTVASFRGGMADTVTNNTDGFLYDYSEVPYLASQIDELFSDDELCRRFSANSVAKAERRHDRERNNELFLRMYEEVYTGKMPK